MKICVVTNRLVKGEGQGRVNYAIVRRAAQAGHRVTCLAHTVSPDLHVRPNVYWAYMPNEDRPFVLAGSLRFARRTTRWLRNHGDDFDVILGNGDNTWAPVDLNVVHFVHSAWQESPVHDARVHSGPYGWYQWAYSSLHSVLERRVIPRAGVVVAVSEKVKRELTEHGIAAERIRVLHNGVNLDRFEPGPADRSALDLPTGVPLALFVGDIQTPRKNLDSVLRALSDVPRLHLAVAGSVDGSPFPDLAARLGVAERTHFLGYRDDVADLMRAADLFAFPSRYEACSLVLLEAMASGLPIVTATTTGGAELVGDEAGVVLDDPDHVDALARAFGRLVDDPDRRASMGRRARNRAEELSWATVGDRYLDLMRQEAAASEAVEAV